MLKSDGIQKYILWEVDVVAASHTQTVTWRHNTDVIYQSWSKLVEKFVTSQHNSTLKQLGYDLEKLRKLLSY